MHGVARGGGAFLLYRARHDCTRGGGWEGGQGEKRGRVQSGKVPLFQEATAHRSFMSSTPARSAVANTSSVCSICRGRKGRGSEGMLENAFIAVKSQSHRRATTHKLFSVAFRVPTRCFFWFKALQLNVRLRMTRL